MKKANYICFGNNEYPKNKSELGTRKKILALIKQRTHSEEAVDPVSREEPAPEAINVTVQAPEPQKSSGGVWAVVGVLIAIVLGLIILASL